MKASSKRSSKTFFWGNFDALALKAPSTRESVRSMVNDQVSAIHTSAPERIHASRGGRGSLKGITFSQPHGPQGACTMTTTTTAATAADTILAIDLGKDKSVACAYERTTAQARFDT